MSGAKAVWMTLFLVSCGVAPERPAVSEVKTTLEGKVWGAQATAVAIVDQATGHLHARVPVQGDQRWRVVQGGLVGDIEGQVELDTEGVWRTRAFQVAAGETRPVAVGPITEWAVAYATHLEATHAPADAWALAERRMYGHFAGVAFDRVAAPPLDPETRLDDRGTAAILEAVLRAQANARGVSFMQWVSILRSDIADGVFDGRAGSIVLRTGDRPLDSFTVRSELGRHLLQWARGPDNPTSLTAADLRPLADKLTENAGPLFPPGRPEPLDDQGPAVTVTVFDAAGQGVEDRQPVRGEVTVVVAVQDESPVAFMDLRAEAGSGDIDIRPLNETRFTVDGSRAPDGHHPLVLTVGDAAGQETMIRWTMVTDHTPPVLTVSARGPVTTATVTLSGTAQDAVGPVVWVEAGFEGGGPETRQRLEADTFTLHLETPCDGVYRTVWVRAIDRAQNQTVVDVPVVCDAAPPVIVQRPTRFTQARDRTIVWSPDGRWVADQWPEAPRQVVWTHPDQQPVFEKDYTRFRGGDDRLPQLRVEVLDDGPVDAVQVHYRYRVDGQVVRPWTPARFEGGVVYTVALSYDTLGPELATAHRDAVHTIELRAIDAAGQGTTVAFPFEIDLVSPPVWWGDCALDPAIQNFTLGNRRFHELFDETTAVAFGQGWLRYAVERTLPTAITSSVAVRFSEAAIRATLDQVGRDTHFGPTQVGRPYPAGLCSPFPQYRTWRRSDGHDEGCQPGPVPQETLAWTREAGALLNEARPVGADIEVRRSGVPVSPSAAGWYRAAPRSAYRVHFSRPPAALWMDGLRYDFSEYIFLPPTLTPAPGAPRYRLDADVWGQTGVAAIGLSGWDVIHRRFETRPYIQAASLTLTARLEAQHPQLDVNVPVYVAPSCQPPLRYVTQL